MNAKMTFTVPINQIPKEVDRLLSSLHNKLELICKESEQILTENDLSNKIASIDSLRKKLALLDLNYDDCHNILTGYSKYLSEKDKSSMDSNVHDNNKNE